MLDLLDLAQMENNTFKLNKKYFSIFEVIQRAFSLVSHVANKKDVFLEEPVILNQDEVPYYSAIYGDDNRYLQVIINFLSNSLKFSNSGSKIKIALKMLES